MLEVYQAGFLFQGVVQQMFPKSGLVQVEKNAPDLTRQSTLGSIAFPFCWEGPSPLEEMEISQQATGFSW